MFSQTSSRLEGMAHLTSSEHSWQSLDARKERETLKILQLFRAFTSPKLALISQSDSFRLLVKPGAVRRAKRPFNEKTSRKKFHFVLRDGYQSRSPKSAPYVCHCTVRSESGDGYRRRRAGKLSGRFTIFVFGLEWSRPGRPICDSTSSESGKKTWLYFVLTSLSHDRNHDDDTDGL